MRPLLIWMINSKKAESRDIPVYLQQEFIKDLCSERILKWLGSTFLMRSPIPSLELMSDASDQECCQMYQTRQQCYFFGRKELVGFYI